jgi:hypothetical protein
MKTWMNMSNHLKNKQYNSGVDNSGTRVPTPEKYRFSITTSPQSTTPLYTVTRNTCEGRSGHLAALASLPIIVWDARGFLDVDPSSGDNIIAQTKLQTRIPYTFRIGICHGFGGIAEAIPGADGSPAWQHV